MIANSSCPTVTRSSHGLGSSPHHRSPLQASNPQTLTISPPIHVYPQFHSLGPRAGQIPGPVPTPVRSPFLSSFVIHSTLRAAHPHVRTTKVPQDQQEWVRVYGRSSCGSSSECFLLDRGAEGEEKNRWYIVAWAPSLGEGSDWGYRRGQGAVGEIVCKRNSRCHWER